MNHALLIAPSSQLPTVVNTQSKTYAELVQAGYQPVNFGTKRDMQDIEQEMMADLYSDCLEMNEN
ncbi:MAG: hypothetical protein V4547_16815 [Bacteroidota bacterium]